MIRALAATALFLSFAAHANAQADAISDMFSKHCMVPLANETAPVTDGLTLIEGVDGEPGAVYEVFDDVALILPDIPNTEGRFKRCTLAVNQIPLPVVFQVIGAWQAGEGSDYRPIQNQHSGVDEEGFRHLTFGRKLSEDSGMLAIFSINAERQVVTIMASRLN